MRGIKHLQLGGNHFLEQEKICLLDFQSYHCSGKLSTNLKQISCSADAEPNTVSVPQLQEDKKIFKQLENMNQKVLLEVAEKK